MTTAQRTPRQPLDFYETPPSYLEALDQYLPSMDRVFEPCVGDGAISNWLVESRGCRVVDNDIDLQQKANYHKDAALQEVWDRVVGIEGTDAWVVTNPPFSGIEPILTHALSYCNNVVSLARLSFLEPTQTRRQLFRAYGEPKLVIVLPRYQFTQPSKDMMTCCWVGWGPQLPAVFKIWTD